MRRRYQVNFRGRPSQVQRSIRTSDSSVDWTKFVDPNSDDYRNVVLLQVAADGWASVEDYSEPSLYYQLAIKGYLSIFRWICENVPSRFIVGVDDRKESAAEVASEFLRMVLPAQAVKHAEEKLRAYLLAYKCGPLGGSR